MKIEQLTHALKQKAIALGFNMVGVVPARPSPQLDAYLMWIEQGYHGEMGYMARDDRVVRRQDLTVILPRVQSLVCVGLEYTPPPLPEHLLADPARGRVSNYAWGTDYHDTMTPRLQELAAWLTGQVADEAQTAVSHRVYVDTGAILERSHAQQAGLGFVGKNSMLIGPQRGSWFFLGELLTTLPLAYDTPQPMPSCGTCTRCLTACPTNAFPQPYVLDARRCISYLTIELKGWIPRDLRPLMGNWIYGCDICQTVCPFNRFAQPLRPLAPSLLEQAAPPLLTLLQLDEAAFEKRFADSPIKRIKRARLVRNACVAAGNWGSPTAVPTLIPLLSDPEPLIRGHAAWALRQIGTPTAQTAVRQAAQTETETAVLAELHGA